MGPFLRTLRTRELPTGALGSETRPHAYAYAYLNLPMVTSTRSTRGRGSAAAGGASGTDAAPLPPCAAGAVCHFSRREAARPRRPPSARPRRAGRWRNTIRSTSTGDWLCECVRYLRDNKCCAHFTLTFTSPGHEPRLLARCAPTGSLRAERVRCRRRGLLPRRACYATEARQWEPRAAAAPRALVRGGRPTTTRGDA